MELADTKDLGSFATACGFKSRVAHHKTNKENEILFVFCFSPQIFLMGCRTKFVLLCGTSCLVKSRVAHHHPKENDVFFWLLFRYADFLRGLQNKSVLLCGTSCLVKSRVAHHHHRITHITRLRLCPFTPVYVNWTCL